MSDSHDSPNDLTGASPAQMQSALFASMVLQQTNMAMMFLGQVPHPDSGKTVTDLEAAQMFISQMEMLEVKTKGNLTKQEEALLKQSLTAVRMAFVDAVEHPEKPGEAPKPPEPPAAETPAPQPDAPPAETPAPAADAESRKKFSKKY